MQFIIPSYQITSVINFKQKSKEICYIVGLKKSVTLYKQVL